MADTAKGTIEEATEMEELQQKLRALKKKCGRLEAQNILVSVQQLDLAARGIAGGLSVASLYVYWKILVYCCFNDWSKQYQALATSESLGSTALFFVDVPWMYLQQACSDAALQMLRVLGLVFLFLWPILHHYRSHGLGHRRFEVFAVFFIVVIRMKLCRWRERVFAVVDESETMPEYGTKMTEDDIWDANYEISARFLYVSILRLQGLWTKSAQYLSSRADFMPPAYVRELQKLQDSAPQTPWDIVKKMMPKHVLAALTDLNETAMASASIGQVHAAVLRKTGEKVVVKVQHPQARTLLMDDFWSLMIFCKIIQWIEPEYGFMGVLMREWSVEARKELDFLQEATNLKDASSSIDELVKGKSVLHTNGSDTPFQVEIPRPYEELSTKDVLVMSFCEGGRIDDLGQIKEWGLPTAAIMDGIAQTFAHMMYVVAPFNGDPHAGNMLVRPGTTESSTEGFTLVLLDWGLAKRLPQQKRLAFCQMAFAASSFDFGLLLDAFKTIGLKMKRENVAEDMEGIRFLLRDFTPREISRKRIKAKIKTDQSRMKAKEKGEKITFESKMYPGDFFFFVRVNELLHGLGSKYGIEMNYVSIIQPYSLRGLMEFAPYNGAGTARPPPTIKNRDDTLVRKLADVVKELREENSIAGAQICALDQSGQPLAHVVDGHLGGLKKQHGMRPDALVLGYSCTKAVTATIAHIMVAEGYLTYDEPVCERVWTRFCPTVDPPSDLHNALHLSEDEIEDQWAWKRQITLRHILTHGSGLWSALPAKLTIKTMASCEDCVIAFEYDSSAPENTLLPSSSPGSKTEYHFMSFGWLVAGTLTGAYAEKHGLESATFEQVYEAILAPRLSKETHSNGFRPCGGDGGFPMAFIDTEEISTSKILQMQREAEAFGEAKEGSDDYKPIRESFRGKEFLLDQRIWNCEQGLKANCPAAGGRFSAIGLAKFYHDLGSGALLNNDTLKSVRTRVGTILSNSLQGETVIGSSAAAGDESHNGRSLGMGYQLIQFENDGAEAGAFGHSGVGGSIGFHHSASGVSVGVMLNKADADKSASTKIVRVIAEHFGWSGNSETKEPQKNIPTRFLFS